MDVLLIGVSLAVAAVPEGLAAILTIVMALGVQRMARRHAIIRTLSAVETLGAATTICSDKTGTLTRNEMTVRRVVTPSGAAVFTGSGYRPHGEVTDESGAPLTDAPQAIEVRDLLQAAVHASNAAVEEARRDLAGARQPHGGRADRGRGQAGCAAGHDAAAGRRGAVLLRRKLMSTVHVVPDRRGRPVFTKGAPDVLLARCAHERLAGAVVPLTAERRAEIRRTVEELADGAMRTLAVGERWIDVDDSMSASISNSDLVYLGVVGMIDPPRDEAAAAVEEARAAGVRLVMITGDHPITAARDRARGGHRLGRGPRSSPAPSSSAWTTRSSPRPSGTSRCTRA